MTKRRHFKRLKALRERLSTFAGAAGEQVIELRRGAERDALLKKARLDDTASNLESWANSSGLRRPK
jgi:hypothetical protein